MEHRTQRRHPGAAFRRRWAAPAAILALLALAACQHEGPVFTAGAPAAGEAGGPVAAERHMIVAGHPLAADAGLEILRAGGSAVDAAIAAEMVLTLVEPQSSGIGGGGFLLHYAAGTGALDAYDGRETAPKSANAYMFLDGTGKPMARPEAGTGGLAVGVPGLLRMLELAHGDHGRLPWKRLFRPAIELASKGFPVSGRMARLIKKARGLAESPVAGTYFFENDGTPKSAGTTLVNRELAATLRRVADAGADAFYSGGIAEAVARAVRGAPRNPGGMTADDLEAYEAKKRPPVCLPYRTWLVCGVGPPTSGGITTLQILGILQSFDLAGLGPDSPAAAHLIGEASRLAFADRNVYIADPDFVPVPVGGLLDPAYLALRAGEIDPEKALGKRQPGMPGVGAGRPAAGGDGVGDSTTHMSVVDGDGNVVSLTASNAWTFGSRLMVRGFILNNQLTDFSFRPNKGGAPVANRAMPKKRPRSSMAPVLVLDSRGRPVMAVGSPGGTRIIGYVAKTLVAALDWKLGIKGAIDYPHVLSRNGPLEIEKGTPLAAWKPQLEKMGHEVELFQGRSGLNGIWIEEGAILGAADKRREGVALGD